MDQFREYLITDRSPADVERVRYLASLWGPSAGQWRGTAAELAEWNAGLKGAYNARDLNRVTLAASYLLTKLAGMGYAVPEDAFPAYMVSVTVDPPGSGRAAGTLAYEGDTATVRAEPIGSSIFLGWKEGGETVSGNADYSFPVNGNRELTALFEAAWVIESSVVGSGRIGKAIIGKGIG